MFKPNSGAELAGDILKRSTCNIKVGAAIEDKFGNLMSWGWNSVGTGFGEHAEIAAIRRCNKGRLRNGVIYVATVRNRNDKVIMSKPCPECMAVIRKWDLTVCYRDGHGEWIWVYVE